LRKLEDPFDVRLGRAGPDDLRTGLAAHQQVERVREDSLARAGLAGDRVQAWSQPELGALDQQQVLDPELEQHRLPVLTTEADGFAPMPLPALAPPRASPPPGAGRGGRSRSDAPARRRVERR